MCVKKPDTLMFGNQSRNSWLWRDGYTLTDTMCSWFCCLREWYHYLGQKVYSFNFLFVSIIKNLSVTYFFFKKVLLDVRLTFSSISFSTSIMCLRPFMSSTLITYRNFSQCFDSFSPWEKQCVIYHSAGLGDLNISCRLHFSLCLSFFDQYIYIKENHSVVNMCL